LTQPASSQEAEYSAREKRFSADAERQAGRSRSVSNLRGLAFAVFIVSLLLTIFGSKSGLSGPLSLASLAAFMALVVWHSRVIAEEDLARRFARVNRDALARNTGRFAELAETGTRFVHQRSRRVRTEFVVPARVRGAHARRPTEAGRVLQSTEPQRYRP